MKIEDTYNKLIQNRFYLSRLDDFMRAEVRKYAMQVCMNKMSIWDRVCTPEYIERVAPTAREAGFNNVLTYQLSKDIEYCRAEAVIKMLNDKPSIPLAQLALIKHYEGEILKKDKSKLYGLWARYHKKVNRIGAEDSDLTNKNKIELFEKVIAQLSGEPKNQAKKDLEALKNNIDNQGFIK